MSADLMKDIKKYLVSKIITDTIPAALTATLGFGKNLFIGKEPASPLNAITLYPTGGPAPDITRLTKNPTFQVRVRNTSWSKGYDVGNAFVRDFHERTNVCASTKSKFYAMQSEPICIGVNDNNTAQIFTVNFFVKMVNYQ